MTSTQIALVQRSFEQVRPNLEPAAAMFYERLFALDPSLRRLFHNSREAQAKMLAQALAVVVKGLERPAQIRGAVEALGQRQAGYGVRCHHYTTVGEALIWTLEQGLGDAFTAEVRSAWTAAYGWLAFVMQEAATDRSICPSRADCRVA
jgi:hemoglobin-like flavoprotein